MNETIYVTVPFYNEEKLIADLVASFKRQTDQRFHVIYVDNNSTDDSVLVLSRAHEGAAFGWEIIEEKEKGTGSASDAGFRYAISNGGVYLARTDADCLVDPDWIASIRRNLIADKLDFVGGVIRARTDDIPLSPLDRVLIPLMVRGAELFAKVKFGGRGFKYPFFMVVGNNLAITADMYKRSGGFPRSSIDDIDEDLVLGQSVRRLTHKARRCRDMIVYNSTRRLKAYGHWNILMWYNERAYKPKVVDIR